MPYIHKKSIRVLTDEQFSRDTSIGGTRIDDALGESVDHFNSVPTGDLSTRFTKSQFVFGYTPAPVTANPVCQRGAVITSYPTTPILRAGTAEALPVQWIALPNSKHTTVKTTDSATSYPDRYKNQDGATPTGGFQNEWKIKGTNIDEYPDGRAQMSNEGLYPTQEWLDFWAYRGPLGLGGINSGSLDVAGSYQLAWTQSWQFERPVIIDDLFLSIQLSELFDITLGYDDTSGNTLPSRGVGIMLHVDNDVAKEDRSANDMEAIFSNRPVFLSFIAMGESRAPFAYADMYPQSPEYAGAAGAGYPGRVMRFRDMNIPIRQNARVRLSVVLPEYFIGGSGENKKGWFRSLPAHIYMQPANNDDNISNIPPAGVMSPLNAVINGSLTVLEEVQR